MNGDVHAWVGSVFLVAVSLLSARSYRRDHAPAAYQADGRSRIESPSEFAWVYAWIRWSTLVSGLAALLWPAPLWLILFASPWTVYLGMGIAWMGFAFFVLSRRALGRHYSPCFDSYVSNAIVTCGPYRRVRHPIYSANLLLMAGLFVLSGSAWIAINLLVLGIYYVMSAVAEERHLVAAHPEYRALKATTGRFLPRMRRRDDHVRSA